MSAAADHYALAWLCALVGGGITVVWMLMVVHYLRYIEWNTRPPVDPPRRSHARHRDARQEVPSDDPWEGIDR